MDTTIIGRDGIARGARPGHDYRATAAELLELLERPAWHADALCREPAYASLEFVAVPSAKAADDARAVCVRCLVRAECLDAALRYGDAVGVWGATTAQQRRALRGRHPRPGGAQAV